jgi:hypothetical protein
MLLMCDNKKRIKYEELPIYKKQLVKTIKIEQLE